MPLKPAQRRSLADDVFEQLRDHIVGGELQPGDALPAERVLAERLQVNRQAVREGLKRLEQAGLIAIQQGGATRVRDFRRSAGLDLLAALLVRPDGTIHTGVVRSVLQMRATLAPDVARFAAQRRGGEVPVRQAIASSAAEIRDAESDGERQAHALAFWGHVVDATENVAFRLAYNALDRSYREVMEYLTHLLREELGAVDTYAELADAILDGDEERAAALASVIVALGSSAVSALLDELDAEVER